MPSTDNSAHDHAASDEHADNTVAVTLPASTANDTIISPIPIHAAPKAPFLQGPPWKRQWEAEQRILYRTSSIDPKHTSTIPSPDTTAGNTADASPATVGVAYEANVAGALCTESSALLWDSPGTPTAVASTSASAISGSAKAIDASQSNRVMMDRSSESPERSPVSAAPRLPYNPYDALLAPVEAYDVHTSLGSASYTAPHDEESWKALVERNRFDQGRAPIPVESELAQEVGSEDESYVSEAESSWDPYAEPSTQAYNVPRGPYTRKAWSPVLTQSFGADRYGHGSHNEHDIDLHNQEDVVQHHSIQLVQLDEQCSPSPAGYEDLGTKRAMSSSPEPAHSRTYEMKIYTPEDAAEIYAEYASRKRGRSVDSDDDNDEGGRASKRRRSVSPSADIGSDTSGSTNWRHHPGLLLQPADSATQHEFNEYGTESSDSSDEEFVAEDE